MNAGAYAFKILDLYNAWANAQTGEWKDAVNRQYHELIEQLNAECLGLVDAKLAEMAPLPSTGNQQHDIVLQNRQQTRALEAGYAKWSAVYAAVAKRLPHQWVVLPPLDQGWIFLWSLRALRTELGQASTPDHVGHCMAEIYALRSTAFNAGAHGSEDLLKLFAQLEKEYPQFREGMYASSAVRHMETTLAKKALAKTLEAAAS